MNEWFWFLDQFFQEEGYCQRRVGSYQTEKKVDRKIKLGLTGQNTEKLSWI